MGKALLATLLRQSDFEQRVKMPVSPQEFGAIKQVFLASDVTFDSFCRRWARMNSERIKQHKQLIKKS